MLNENIKALRKSKGLSQEELAIKLNVVFETPVSTLLGETVAETKASDLSVISEKLEVINLQLARGKASRRTVIHWSFISLCVVIVAVWAVLTVLNSPYLGWDFSNPETAVVGVIFHAFEWLFVRIAPLALIGAVVGVCLTRKRA